MVSMPQIQPLQLPAAPQVPQLDFAPLGNLITDYQQQKANQMKLANEENKQKVMGGLAGMGTDPDAMIRAGYAMLPYDASAGASMIKTGTELKQQASVAASLPKPGVNDFPTPAPAPAPTSSVVNTGNGTQPIGPGALNIPTGPTAPGAGLPTMAQLPTPKPIMPPIAPAAPNGPAPPMMAQQANQPAAGYMAAPDKNTVRFSGVNQEFLQVANEVGNSLYGTLRRPLYVTSARDSTHTPNSQHYGGDALDLRTRDLNSQQRSAIVAGFRAKGYTAVDEGDHIHVATPRGGATPQNAGPGTVMASLQGRGPLSIGAGGNSIRTASVDQSYLPPTTASDAAPGDISPVPMARTSESPASVTNPGGQQSTAEPPSALAAPSLAAPRTAEIQPGLGIPPLGTGTDAGAAPPIVPRGPIAPPADPVQQAQQVAQAQIPLPPPRPPVAQQQAPAPAPTLPQPAPAPAPIPQPPVARQAMGNQTEQEVAATGPFPKYSTQRLVDIAGRIPSNSPYSGYREAMLKEVERRTSVLSETSKNPDILKYNWMKANGYTGTPADYMRDFGGGQRIQIGGGEPEFQKEEGKGRAALITKEMQGAIEAGALADRTISVVDTVQEIMPNVGGNIGTSLALAAGKFGIQTKGLTEAQIAQSLLTSLIPKQREEGSGTSSDKDMAVFADMIPNMMKNPAANAVLMSTMKTYAQYQKDRSRIARLWAAGKLDGATAMEKLQALDDAAAPKTAEAVRKIMTLQREQAKQQGAPGATRDESGLRSGNDAGFKRPPGVSVQDWTDTLRGEGFSWKE